MVLVRVGETLKQPKSCPVGSWRLGGGATPFTMIKIRCFSSTLPLGTSSYRPTARCLACEMCVLIEVDFSDLNFKFPHVGTCLTHATMSLTVQSAPCRTSAVASCHHPLDEEAQRFMRRTLIAHKVSWRMELIRTVCQQRNMLLRLVDKAFLQRALLCWTWSQVALKKLRKCISRPSTWNHPFVSWTSLCRSKKRFVRPSDWG